MSKRPKRSVPEAQATLRLTPEKLSPNPLASAIRAACLPASLAFLTFHAGMANAGPEGGEVMRGQGNISKPNASTTLINQQSKNLSINWNSYNVGKNELVKYNQPSRTATALNRIFDQNPSQIFGSIRANGNVILINPSGIFFSPTARVNVNSLVASSLDMSDDDFFAGNYKFRAAPGTEGGLIVNQGVIEAATGGSVSLVGGAVKNEGVILAQAGQVNLVAGNQVTMDFDGDGLMQFTVDKGVLQNAQALDSAVSNTGTIEANGGSVLLAGSAAADVFSNVVNNEGVIKAGRIDNTGGVVRLVGVGADASVLNTGTIDVSAADATSDGGTIEITGTSVTNTGTLKADSTGGDGGTIKLVATDTTIVSGNAHLSAIAPAIEDNQDTGGKGGTVQILGDKVALLDLASVDVSGAIGGGTVLIGGDYQGNNPEIQNSNRTYVGENVTINADAINDGDGGKVIVWADEVTRFHGNISARGGADGGDGGFAEVSGKEHLDFTGLVDLRAPQGNAGTLLLDPTDIEISNNATDLDLDTAGDPDIFEDAGDDGPSPSTLNVTDLQNQLALSNVLVTTASGFTDAGNITVVDAVSWNSGFTLTLDADNNIVINNTITNTSTGGLTLTAVGNVDINAGISLTSGTFDSSGVNFDSVGQTISAGSVVVNHSGTVALGQVTTTGTQSYTGATTLNGNLSGVGIDFNNAVTIAGATVSVDATTGALTFDSTVTGDAGTEDLDVLGDTVTVTGAVTNLATFDATGTTSVEVDAVTTTGAQSYTGATTLNGNLSGVGIDFNNAVTIAGATVSVDATTGALTFDSTVTGDAGTEDLDVLGDTVTVTGAVTNLATFDATGTTSVEVDAVTTTGAQSYTGATTLNGNLSGVGIDFNNAVTIAGATVSVDATTGALTFDSTVTGGAGTEDLDVLGDTVTVTGAVTNLATFDATGTTSVDVNNISTTGNISLTATNIILNGPNYFSDDGSITLTGDVSLDNAGVVTIFSDADTDSTSGDITITGTVDDDAVLDSALNIDAGTADVTLNAVGTGTQIGSLGIDGNNVALNGDVESSTISIFTTGASDSINIAAGVTLDANGSDISLNSNDITAGAGASLTSTGAAGQSVIFAGNAAASTIGVGDTATADLELTLGVLAAVDGTTFDSIIIGGAAQTGTITVNDSGNLSGLTADLHLNAGGGDIVIDGAIDLSTVAGVGITITGDGSTTFLNANMTTDGADIIINDTVLVDGAITLDSGNGGASATAGLIQITGDIGAEGTGTDSLNLQADGTADGNVDLQGIVGTGGTVNAAAANPLTSLTVAGAQVDLNNVTTTDAISITGTAIDLNGTTYTGSNVTFTGDVNLAAGGNTVTVTANGGTDTDDVTFTQDINDAGSDDTLSVSVAGDGDAVFQGAIGGVDALVGFEVTDADLVDLQAVTTTTNGVDLTADNMSLGGTITATGQTVVLQTSTANQLIDLGGADAAGTLGLTSTELNNVTANLLRIGNATSGDISVTAAIAPTGTNTLSLVTGGTITQTNTITETNLALTAGGAITLNSANDVDTLAINNAGNAVSFTDADGFSVGSVDGIDGISGSTVSLTATTGNLTVTDTGVGNDIDATDAVTVTLSADDAVFTIDANADVETTTGGVIVNADDMALNGTIHATGQTVTLRPRSGSTDAIRLGANPGTANILELNNAELDNVFATTLVIGSSTAGAITVDVGANADIDPANITNLHLVNNSTVTATAGGIVVSGLAISSNGAINIADATTDVDTLAVLTSNDSITQFTDADGLAIGSVDGVNGINTGAANTRLTAAGFTQTQTITANDLTLTSTGAVTLNSANDVNTLSISASGQTVQFTDADGFDVDDAQGTDGITSAALTLTATTGNITVTDVGVANDINASGAVAIVLSGDDATFTVNTNADVETSAGGITIDADKMAITGTITGTGQTVTLRPESATDTDAIDLGSAVNTTADTLELSATELNNITAGTLVIGSATSGAITVSNDITPGGTNTLSLITGSTIGQQAGDVITETNLALTAGAAITLNEANVITTLAVSNAGNSVAFTESDTLIIGSVAGINGISGSTVTITVTGNNLTINDTGAANDIDATGAVTLQAAGEDDDLIISAGADVETTAGGITLVADNLDLSGTLHANNTLVTLRPDDATAAIQLGTADANDILGISAAELDNIFTTGGITIGSGSQTGNITVVGAIDQTNGTPSITGGTFTIQNSSGNIAVNEDVTNSINTTLLTTSGDISFDADGSITAAGQTVTLTGSAAGSSINTVVGAGTNITASTVNLTAHDNIGANANTDISVNLAAQTISAHVTNTDGTNVPTNDINITNFSASDVSITGMSTRNDVVTSNPTFDPVAIRYSQSGGGDLTIDGAVTSGAAGSSNGSDISISNPTASLTVNASISTADGAGGVLTASGVTINVAPTLGAGDITLTAASDDTIITSDILNTDTVITLMADRDIIIQALLQTTDTDANTANDNITLIADNDNDGEGGVWLKDIGEIISDGSVTMSGSDVFNIAVTTESVQIDADTGGLNQITAATGITLTSGAFSPDNAFINIGGIISTAAGGVTVTADKMAITNTILATGQIVTLRNEEMGELINIGSTTDAAADTLELSNTELGNIQADTLRIGRNDADASGNVTISSTIDLTSPAEADNLHIITGGGVSGTVAPLAVSGLAITAGNTVNITDAATDVDTLAVITTNDNLTFVDADGVAIGTVDGVIGINTGSGNTHLTAGSFTQTQTITAADLTLVSTGAVTLNSANDVNTLSISAAGQTVQFTDADGFDIDDINGVDGITSDALTLTATTGNITITDTTAANDVDTSGATTFNLVADEAMFAINTGGNVNNTGGGVTVNADKMDLDGTITATGQVVTLRNQELGELIDLGSTTDAAADTLELSDAELSNIQADTLRIGRNDGSASGNVTISAAIDLTDNAVEADVLHIITGGNVTDTAAVTVSGLAISAGDFVSLNASHNIDTLAAVLTGEGDFFDFFNEADGFAVDTVDGINGITTANTTSINIQSGDISLSTANGDITINQNITTGNATATAVTVANTEFAGSGDISITAGGSGVISGAGIVTTGDATLTNDADATDNDFVFSGVISLSANEISADGAATVATDGLNVSIGDAIAATGDVATAGSVFATVDGTGDAGEIYIESTKDLKVGTLDTTDGDTTNVTIELTAGNLLTVSSASNLDRDDLTLISDTMDIQNTISFAAGMGTATVQSTTAGAAINLGTVTDATLELSSTEIQNLAANQVTIGDAGAGAITVTNANVSTAANTSILHLITGSTMTATANGINVSNLAVEAGDTVNITNGANTVTFLAIDATGESVTFTQDAGFGVAPVGLVNGITSADLTLTSANGSITVFNPGISATGAIDINVNGNDQTFAVTAGSDVATTAGNIDIVADKMDLNGTITATGQMVTLNSANAGDAIDLGSTTDAAANTLELSDAELDGITATTLRIGSATSGAITVTNSIDLANGGAADDVTNLHLQSGSTITDSGAGALLVSGLAITSVGSVTLDGSSDVDTLAASVTGAGNNFTFINDVDGFAVDTVDSVVGVTTANVTAAGPVTTGSISLGAAGTITFNQNVTTGNATATAAGNNATSGSISVDAGAGNFVTGAGTLVIGSATANGGVSTAQTGDISLTAAEISGDAVSNPGAASLVPLTVSFAAGTGGAINLQGVLNATATGSTLDGEINVTSAGPLNVGTLDTTNADATNVTVTVTGGNALTIAGSSSLDIDDVVLRADRMLINSTITSAETVTLRSNSAGRAIDLGSATDAAAALELSAAELNNITTGTLIIGDTGAGAISITDVINATGTTILGLITNSTISQTAGDTLTETNLALTANGAITLNEANDVSTLAVSTSNDSVSFTDANGFSVGSVAGGTVTTGVAADVNGVSGSTVSLTASNGNLVVTNVAAAANDIDATGVVTLTAQADDTFISINSGADVEADGGATLTADKMDIDGTITATGQIVTLAPESTSDAGDAINLGSTTDAAANTLELSDAELNNITAATLRVGATDAGAITVSAAGVGPNSVTTNFTLLSDAGVSQSGAGSITFNGGLRIDVDDAVALATNANDVNSLAANVSTAGQAFAFADSDGLTVTTVDTTVGVTTNNAQINISAGGNDNTLTVSQAIASGGGNINLSADKMALGAAVNAGTGIVTLTSANAGDAINLGSAVDTTGNTLELSDTELDNIAASVLRIGTATADDITVSADVSHGATTTLHLITGSAVTATAGGILGDKELAIEAGDAVNFTDASTAVSSLAITTSGDSVTFVEANGFSVDAVDGVVGIDGSTVSLTATTGNLTVQDTADANDINATNAVTLTASAADADVIIVAGADVETTSGGVTVSADNIDLSGTIHAAASLVTLRPTANAQTIELGTGAADSATVLGLDEVELANIFTTGGLTIGSVNQTGTITVVGVGDITNVTGGTVSLLTDSADILVNDVLTTHTNTTLTTASTTATATNAITFGATGAIDATGFAATLNAGGNITVQDITADTIALNIDRQNNGAHTLTINGVLTATTSASADGQGTNDTLVAPNVVNTFTVNALNGGTLASAGSSTLSFTDFANLTGNADVDIFDLNASLDGAILGLAGNDEFNALVDGITITGDITGGDDDDTFNIDGSITSDLIGGNGLDTFNIADSVTGAVTGDAGDDDFNVTADGVTVSGNIDGGANDDTFDITGSVTSDLIGNAGIDTFNIADNVTGAVTGDAGNDDFNVTATATVTGGIDGGIDDDTFDITGDLTGDLIGNAGVDTFNLDANVTGAITGDAGDDVFNLTTDGITISGDIDGGADADQFNVYNDATTDIFGQAGDDVFNLREAAVLTGDLNGGDGDDTFDFNDAGDAVKTARVVGSVNGNNATTPDDTIDFSDSDLVVTLAITGVGAPHGQNGTITGTPDLISAGFTNIDTFVGNNGLFVGPAGNTWWNITGTDSGTFGNSLANIATSNFTAFAISAGVGDDTFIFQSTGQITGATGIDGGGGFNTLVGSMGDDAFTIQGSTSVDVTVDVGGNNLTTVLTNINLIDGTQAFVTVTDGSETDTGNDTFNIDNDWVGDLKGVGGDDAFIFADGTTVGGSIDGGIGSDTLDWSAYTTARNVTLNVLDANGADGEEVSITGDFFDVEVITGSTTATGTTGDSINGLNTTSTWDLTGANAGTYTVATGSLDFNDFDNLNGTAANDTFEFNGGSLSGVANGQGGTNTLDYATHGSAVTVTITDLGGTTDADGLGMGFEGTGSIVGGFDNITDLIGSDLGDTLTGDDANATWAVTTTDDGTYTDTTSTRVLNFTNIANLTGGSAADTFTLTAALSGNITGGNGTNNYNLNSANADVGGNIIGGTGSDTIDFNNAGATVAGTVDGGAGGTNTLDYAGIAGPITVNLQTAAANNIFAGAAAGFSNINNLVGSADTGDTLIGQDDANTWTIDAADSGDVDAFTFSSIENLTGGTDVDDFILDGGTLTGTIDGAAGSDSITGDAVANTWNITGTDSGDVTGIGDFTSIENLNGNSNTDDFIFNAGASVAGSITGAGDVDTLDWESDNFNAVVTVTLTGTSATGGFAGTATGIGVDFDGINVIIGDANEVNTLVGRNADATWTITGTNDGTYLSTNTLTWTDFENLTGGGFDDTFTFTTGDLTGNIDGGGENTATGDRINIAAQVGANMINLETGEIDAGTTFLDGTFTDVEAFTGDNTDDTLVGTNANTLWTIDGANDGTLDTGFSFINIPNLTGGTADDNFTLTGAGSIAGTIDGGATGTDTLTGDNESNTWTINGANAGTLDGATNSDVATFTDIENLVGGTSDDSFEFDAGSSISGNIDGDQGTDTLDWGNFNADVSVTLTADGTVDGFQGTTTGGIGGTFDNIDELEGDAGQTNTLTGDDVAATWTINGADDGTYTNGTPRSITWEDFENLVGGSDDDTFAFQAGGSISGTIDGGGETTADEANYAALGAITVSIGTGVVNVEQFVGNNTNQTLVADNTANTWIIGGVGNNINDGTLNATITFLDFANITGGTNTDAFNITTGSMTGDIDGGAGSDTLDYSGIAVPPANIVLTDPGSTDGFAGDATSTGGFDNINIIIGSGGTDSITGDDVTSAWVIDNGVAGPNTYTAGNSLDFEGFENINGSSGSDTFDVSTTSFTGNINGGDGANTYNIDIAMNGNLTGGTGTDIFNINADLNGNVITGDGSNTINVDATLTGNITGGGGVDIFNINPAGGGTGSVVGSLAGNAGDDIFNIAGAVSGGTVNGGQGANDFNLQAGGSIASSISVTTNEDTAGDTFTLTGGTISGNINVTGNATWNWNAGNNGNALTSGNVTGTGNVQIPVAGVVTIGNSLILDQFSGFAGHLIVGGSINPIGPTMTTGPDVTITATDLSLDAPLITAGNITLLGSNIDITDDISAGGAGGGELVIIGAVLGAPSGSVDASAGLVTLSAGSGFILSDGTLNNTTNMILDFGGGPIEVATGQNSGAIQFGPGSNATGSPTASAAIQAIIGALGAYGSFNVTQVVISNPAADLIGLEELGFIDTGLFEEDLTLFGVIGNGIALALAQCEEIEGCAPNVTDAELIELIAQLEARIAELEKRCDAGDEAACQLIEGYKQELANFVSYRQQLQEYLTAGEEELQDDFTEEFDGEGSPVTPIDKLARMLETIKARITWLESLKTDPDARARLGEQTGIELTLEMLDAIIEGAKQEAKFIEKQIEQMKGIVQAQLQASVNPITPMFAAESADYSLIQNIKYGPGLLNIDHEQLAIERLY